MSTQNRIRIRIRISKEWVDIAHWQETLHQGVNVVREVQTALTDAFVVQFVPAVQGGETSTGADVEVQYKESHLRLSEQHVRALLAAQVMIPVEIRNSALLFPGIILALERIDFTPHPVVRMKQAMMSARFENGKWQAATAWLDGRCSGGEYVVLLQAE